MSQLQADGTRFNLFYSADGCNGASQIHFCDAKVGIILHIHKFITNYSIIAKYNKAFSPIFLFKLSIMFINS